MIFSIFQTLCMTLPCCSALDKVQPYSADIIRDELDAINGRRTNQALQDIKDVVDLLENSMNLRRRSCYRSTRPPGTNHTHDAPVGGACSHDPNPPFSECRCRWWYGFLPSTFRQ